MTPLDEAPEQRWRRTVDRRNRPAKLKVDRLLRDFGYADLDPGVGDAIEERLAGVALAVAPSLRDAVAGEVVTIYANDSAAREEERAPPDPAAADPVPAAEPAVAADVAQMVSYLKQQVFDARAEAERLRTELDRRIAGRLDAEREKETIIAEQAAALEEQRRQLAELGAALNTTREALAETRDEIRRAVGELQALPEPEPGDRAAARDPERAFEPEPEPEPALALDEPDLEVPALDLEDEPAGGDAVEPDFDLEEPAIAVEDEPAADVREPEFDLDEPALAPRGEAPAPDDEFGAEDPLLTLDEQPEPSSAGDGDPDPAEPPEDRRTESAPADEFDEPAVPEAGHDEPADAPATSASPPSSEWLPPDLQPPPGDRQPIADARPPAPGQADVEPDDDDRLTDFDDFLYDEAELYERADGADDPDRGEPLDSEIAARWPDEPSTALPPPPPAPPSPWAHEAEAPVPPAERPTLGKVLRGRGRGRARGRWDGSCSICGRLPMETRRKDLEAAGWDLDDDAAACPQCRGVG